MFLSHFDWTLILWLLLILSVFYYDVSIVDFTSFLVRLVLSMSYLILFLFFLFYRVGHFKIISRYSAALFQSPKLPISKRWKERDPNAACSVSAFSARPLLRYSLLPSAATLALTTAVGQGWVLQSSGRRTTAILGSGSRFLSRACCQRGRGEGLCQEGFFRQRSLTSLPCPLWQWLLFKVRTLHFV